MSDEPQNLIRRAGDEQFDAVIALNEAFRAAATEWFDKQPDPIVALSVLGSAAAMFAGVQFGQLIAAGSLQDQDTRRIIENIAGNARQGVKVGKKRGARIKREIGGLH
jgi:hypothetical protein